MENETQVEWQPARAYPAHGLVTHHPEVEKRAEEAQKRILHIRPIHIWELARGALAKHRALGCDATQFFAIEEYPEMFLCEHEILTD